MKIQPQTAGKDRVILSHAEAAELRRELNTVLDDFALRMRGGETAILAELRDKLNEAGRREVGPAWPVADDSEPVFYTIRLKDVGRQVIETEVGSIRVREVMGRVLKVDVGKRLTRIQTNGGWHWQLEGEAQRSKRTAGER